MLPRGVECNNGKFSWDKIKIAVNRFADDNLMLENVFHGKIISSNIYPLVYDGSSEEPQIKYRCLEFYNEVVENNKLYEELTHEQKIYFTMGIRDLYIASQRNLLSNNEKKMLKRIVNVVEDNFMTININ